MRRFSAPCLGAVLLVFGVGAWTLREVPPGRATDLSSQELALEGERTRDLDVRIDAMHDLRLARQDIVADLQDGRLSLDEALDRFRALKEHDPTSWNTLRAHFPARSEDELLGFQIAICVANHAGPAANRRAFFPELVRRLRTRFGASALIPTHLERSQR